MIAIPADSRSGTITVQTTDDSTYETDHYLTVSLAGSDGSWGISSAAGSAVGTITDEADVPVFEFSASTSKVAENAGSAAIKITRTGESVVASTLSYATSAISATADEDYVSQTKGSLSFAPADATRTVMVTITDDVTDETDETFVLDLSAVTHARIGTTARHTVTIQDNDSVPAALTLSASLNEVAEDAGATEVTVTATLDGAGVFDTDKTVQVSVGGGTATSTEDYAAVSSFGIKIAAGQASGSGKFTLTPIDDVLDEADSETVQVTGALVGVSVTADEIAITDNDAAPSVITLTVDADTGTDNVQSELAEGGGAKTVEVTATITGSTQFESDRTVTLTVSGDTATAIDDYADVAAQSIVIQAGEAAGTTEFEIAPVDDNIDEPTEAISIEGELSGVTVTGTSVDITDNDETPSALTIEVDTDTATDGSQDSVGEDAGTVTVRVKAVLDGASTFAELKNVTVTVGDSSDSATETNDYASVDDFTISIAAGQSSGFADISLKPKNDAVDESDESITIKGVLTGVTVTNDEIIIIDADQPPQVILKLTPSSIDESGNGNVSVVTASLTGGTSSETVKLTVSATAVSPAVEGDYTLSANKVLTIAPETVDSSGLVTIAAVDNQVFAAAKVVTVSAEVSGTSGVANPDSVDLTINEDDAAPAGLTLSVSPSNVGEQDGDSSVTVTAMLDGGITFTEDTTVTVSVGDGTAVSPGDYAPVDDFKIAIPAGQSSGTDDFTLTPVNDAVDEHEETVSVTGTHASQQVTASGDGIVDNDPKPVVSIAPMASAIEGGTISFEITLSAESGRDATVNASTSISNADTAEAADFTAKTNEAVTIAAGGLTANFEVQTAADNVIETSETFTVTLSSPVNATLDSQAITAAGTIIDANSAPTVTSIKRHMPASPSTNADSLTWRVTFSEAVVSVDALDFEVSGTGIGQVDVAVASGDSDAGEVWDVTASGGNLATLDDTVTIGFAADQDIEDRASSGLSSTIPSGANENSYQVDNTGPTVTIDVPSSSSAAFTATFTFNETVTGFVAGDIQVTNGSASVFNEDTTGTVWSATITPARNGKVTIALNKDAALDRAGNGSAAADASSQYDPSAPTVTISGVPEKINSTADLTVTFNFSKPVTDFVSSDVSMSGGSAKTFSGGGTSYTMVVTPDGDRDVVVTVAKDAATDGVNTGPAAAESATAQWDVVAPTVAIGVPEKINKTAPFTVTFTFSEDVTDFEIGDVTVSGGTKGLFSGSGTGYTLVVTPDGGVDVVVTVAKDAANDGVNTGPAAAETATAAWDDSVPTVTIGGVPGKINSTADLSVTFTFSETVTDFVTGDVTVSGGAKKSFSGSGAGYALVVTPDGDVDVVVTVAKDAATDGINTGPETDKATTAVWDAVAPTLTIGGVPEKINSTADFTATFTFSEDVTDFEIGDVTVSGGMKKTFTESGKTEYALVVTPDGDVDVVLTVVKDAATDGVNTAPAAPEVVMVEWDETGPTVSSIERQAPSSTPTNADSLTWRVTFSETVVNVGAADFELSGTGIGQVDVVVASGDFDAGEVWDVTASGGNLAELDRVVTLGFASGQDIKDGAGNALDTTPPSVNENSYELDNTAPTVSSIERQTPSSTPTNADSLTWRVTFSDAVSVDAADFAVSGTDATLAVASGDSNAGVVWDVTALGGDLAELDGTVTFGFANGQDIEDGAGNVLDATAPSTNENSYVLDNTGPTVTKIAGVPAKINTKDPLSVTFTFSEAVTGFGTEDVTVTGGAKGAITVTSASQYTLVVTPNGAVNVKITVAENGVTDESGNTGPASAMSVTAEWDAAAPTVAIGVPEKINTITPFTATFTFSESVTGFDATDVTVSGGTAGTLSGNGRDYTLVVTPNEGEGVTVTVAKDAATDEGGNKGPESAVKETATWDTAAPTVAIGVPEKINTTAPFTVTFIFSEDVTGFDATDVTMSGGTAEAFSGSGASYALVVTPDGDVDVVVTVVKDAATDGVNRGPAQDAVSTSVWDETAPTVAIGVPEKINTTVPFKVTFTFSENVTGFDATDVDVSGGTKGTFSGSAKDYTLVVTPTSGKDLTVKVTQDAITDGVNSGPTQAVSKTAEWDADAPTLAISGVPDWINSTADLTVTFTFSESVTDFLTGDVEVNGGTKGMFSGSGASYALVVTPDNGKNVVVTVAKDSATDGANTGPAAAESKTAVWDNTAPVLTITGVNANTNAPFKATFSFDETVTGFAASDIQATNATVSGFTETTAGKAWSTLVTPQSAGAVTIKVAANAAQDAAGNGSAAATASSDYDPDAPTVSSIVRRMPSTTPTNADSLTWRVTFSEAVVNVDANDFAVSGTDATLTATNSDSNVGEVWDVTASGGNLAELDGTVTLGFAEGQDIQDGAGNALDASAPLTNENSYGVDNTVPTVSIDGLPGKINSKAPFTAMFTFSENMVGFDASTADVTVVGGTKGAATGSGKVYKLVVSPEGSKDVTVTVVQDSALDAVGNAGPVADVSAAVEWDSVAPSVESIEFLNPLTSPTRADSLTWRVTFSEAVLNVSGGDFTVSGDGIGRVTVTVASGDSDAGKVWDVTASRGNLADLDGAVTLGFEADQNIKDSAGNALASVMPTGTNEASYRVDNTAPTVAISGVPGKINSTSDFTATFTFSEDVTGFEKADVNVAGGTAGAFTETSAAVYKLVVSPDNGEDVVVTVKADSATDGANTGPPEDEVATAEWDGSVPTLTITGVPGKINSTSPYTATFTFSEAVTDFDTDDVTVSDAKKGQFTATSATVYKLVVIPEGSKDVTLTVWQDAATDGVNTVPVQDATATAKWDETAPTVTIGMPEWITSTNDFIVTFTFSEDVTGFDADDVDLLGGTKGTFSTTSAAVYTLVVTPHIDSALVVTVRQDAATDGVNTGPVRAEIAATGWDADAPTVTIGGMSDWITAADDFTATFTFSETVTGFDASDVDLAGATKGAFSGSGASYALVVT
ncbi:MAG: hypothetical protein F4239_04080, partial [Gammaproteobacteria bacterium]|nr:hypothetical protein [Gammaproteobacteria bacterium]